MTPVRLLIVTLSLLASTPTTTSTQRTGRDIDGASLAALEEWVEAVRTHTPGESDASVVTVASWSYQKREDLNSGVGVFLATLMGWRVTTDGNKAAETIRDYGKTVGKEFFLKRAAVLHADAAAYGDLVPQRITRDMKGETAAGQELQLDKAAKPMALRYRQPIPPLLMQEPVMLNQDGQILGRDVATWNWPFARSLLDLLSAGPAKKIFSDGRPNPATDPFVSEWYHATTAYMFARGLYADSTPHLQHASRLLPDDPLVLFDRASYAEVLGLPILQALIPEADVGQLARASGAPTWKTPGSEIRVEIPSAARTNADAEALFRKVLKLDPSLVEARVRLARLLQVRGRHEESATELDHALAQKPTGVVAFYGHLFAGRAAESTGRSAKAATHFTEANALFPDAQSALLALSRHALLQADIPATTAPIERLGARSLDSNSDPWWQYEMGAGRDADLLLKTMWAHVPR